MHVEKVSIAFDQLQCKLSFNQRKPFLRSLSKFNSSVKATEIIFMFITNNKHLYGINYSTLL